MRPRARAWRAGVHTALCRVEGEGAFERRDAFFPLAQGDEDIAQVVKGLGVGGAGGGCEPGPGEVLGLGDAALLSEDVGHCPGEVWVGVVGGHGAADGGFRLGVLALVDEGVDALEGGGSGHKGGWYGNGRSLDCGTMRTKLNGCAAAVVCMAAAAAQAQSARLVAIQGNGVAPDLAVHGNVGSPAINARGKVAFMSQMARNSIQTGITGLVTDAGGGLACAARDSLPPFSGPLAFSAFDVTNPFCFGDDSVLMVAHPMVSGSARAIDSVYGRGR